MPKILIVEDGTVAHDNLGGVFAGAGVDPTFTHSTTEALELYRAGGIDLVLTEVRMPLMDGILLTRKLRQIDPDAAVICMTALERRNDLRRAIREGVFDFFVKPFSAHEMTECLQRAVAFRQRIANEEEAGPAVSGALAKAPIDLPALAQIEAREMALAEREAQLERAVAEFEAMEMGMNAVPQASAPDEREAALEAREASLADREALVEEREAFLEQSENALFDKGQHLQELETELDHRAEGVGGKAHLTPVMSGGISAETAVELEERVASLDERERDLEKRFATLLEREKRLKKNEALIRAREQYLRESENILFESEDGV